MCFNITIIKCCVSDWTDMSNFHPLEVVGRGSEKQLQVGENLYKKTQRGNPLLFKIIHRGHLGDTSDRWLMLYMMITHI